MSNEWLAWLGGASFVAGSAALVVLALLHRHAVRTQRATERLIAANQVIGFEAQRFLEAAWPILAEAGALGCSLAWQWYGVSYEERRGECPARGAARFPFHAEVPEISVAGALYVRGGRGEQSYFWQRLAETLALLLALDLWRAAAAVEKGFALWSRSATLLLHDVKNLAQFVAYLPAVLETGSSSERVRQALPVATERAERILRRLSRWAEPQRPAAEGVTAVALGRWIAAALARAGVTAEVRGEAIVAVAERLLAEVVQELIDNSARHGARIVRVEVTPSDGAQALARFLLSCPEPVPPQALARWFQPFFSGDGQGMGLGLAQAQWAAKEAGGALTAQPVPEGAAFCLQLPLYGNRDSGGPKEKLE